MGLFNKFKKNERTFSAVVFTCSHCMNGEKISYVSHKNNNDYELLCSDCANKLDLNAIRVAGLEEISSSIAMDFLNIKKGYYIKEDSGNWYEYKIENTDYNNWVSQIQDKIIKENIKRNKQLRSDLSGIKILKESSDCL